MSPSRRRWICQCHSHGSSISPSLIAYWFIARVSLMLPAIAIDRKPDLGAAWQASRRNGWRLAIVVGLLPWCLQHLVDLLFRDGASTIEFALLVSGNADDHLRGGGAVALVLGNSRDPSHRPQIHLPDTGGEQRAFTSASVLPVVMTSSTKATCPRLTTCAALARWTRQKPRHIAMPLINAHRGLRGRIAHSLHGARKHGTPSIRPRNARAPPPG